VQQGNFPVSDLAEICDDLPALINRAAQLIPQPDTQTGTSHGKPGSRPPWNPAAAAAYYDTHAQIRETETVFRYIVTGHTGPPRSWSDTNTIKALAAILSLSHAVPADHVKRAARDLARCATVIMQLAAVDEAERAQRIPATCPYCQLPMLWVYPRQGLVACLRGGVCVDSDGRPPRGMAIPGRLGPCIEWSDGLVT
jgi:hypothetical protein